MYARLSIVGKNEVVSKAGKRVHFIYAAILESASEYDSIEEGYKTVTAFVKEDVYKDINRKDVIAGNLQYREGNYSFWPYGLKKEENLAGSNT